nr:molecular chaperone [Providencia alcalifaciens]
MKKITFAALLFFSSFLAYSAGLSLNKTRIIFNEGDKSASITFKNNVDSPFLVQNEIYDIDNKKSDFFVITPSIFRVEKNSTFMMRIFPASLNLLPKDRESVFYFSSRAIPPKRNDEKSSGKLSIVTNLVIKLYYRPKNLPITAKDSYEKISVSYANNALTINNPTPYYTTLVDMKVNNTRKIKNKMVAPYSNVTISDIAGLNSFSWRIMNDYGGTTKPFIFESKAKKWKWLHGLYSF